MHTLLAPFIAGTADGAEAEAILRACVHCGFCTATCPTYQVLGDELDGPRGRIYLIKQVLEGAVPTRATQTHLDRCLTCRSCETTCPSGVRYARLADIGRKLVDQRVTRPAGERAVRFALKQGLTRSWIFGPAYRLGQSVRPLLPKSLRAKVMAPTRAGVRPGQPRARKMLVLEGCAQPAMAPSINAAAARVLDRVGVQLISARQAGCCGAVRYHLDDPEGAMMQMRRNIDAWWPLLDEVEAIVMTASGCGAMIKEYAEVLAHDPAYADKARAIVAKTRDLSEVLAPFTVHLAAMVAPRDDADAPAVAFHSPCTLQHAQRIGGKVEALLGAAGMRVTACADSHLCCGSAGTYSVLQPVLAGALRERKLANLEAGAPQVIASANIGCIAHLQGGTATPVKHWIELLDAALAPDATAPYNAGSAAKRC